MSGNTEASRDSSFAYKVLRFAIKINLYPSFLLFFFLNDPAPTETSPLPLPAPLPICPRPPGPRAGRPEAPAGPPHRSGRRSGRAPAARRRYSAPPLSRSPDAAAALRPDAPREPGCRGHGAAPQHLRVARPRTPPRQRRVRLQRARPGGLRLSDGKGRLRPLPRPPPQRQGVPLGRGGGEADPAPPGGRGRPAPQLPTQHPLRRAGGRPGKGRVARRGPPPVDAGSVG